MRNFRKYHMKDTAAKFKDNHKMYPVQNLR